MQAVTVADVADELYSLTPAEFTAARDERAKAARTTGQRELAAAIKKLARPTSSAWLVNQLTRAAAAQMARLFEVGEALGEAQRALAGDRLRELAAERRQAVSDLLPVASELAERAGQPASQPVLLEVRATLEAALADPDARSAVRTGQLTKSLAYAGLGEVDLTAALAVPAQPARAGSRRPAAKVPAGKVRAAGRGKAAAPQDAEKALDAEEAQGTEKAQADRAVREAQTAVEQDEAALAAAEREVTSLAEQRQFLRRRVDHLERELDQTRAEEAQLALDAKQAGRNRDSAARQLDADRALLAKARQHAGGSP